jgi:hypothetical protein
MTAHATEDFIRRAVGSLLIDGNVRASGLR